MDIETLISKILERVEADGKQGKDLNLSYIIRILREIYEDETF